VKRSILLAVLFSALCVLGCKKKNKGPPFQAQDLALGSAHACALMKEGTVRCWGANAAGQLGEASREDHPRPVVVTAFAGATDFSAGGESTCARIDNGKSVRCAGKLGAADLSALHDVATLTVGAEQACVTLSDRTAQCFSATSSPRTIPGLADIDEVAVGGAHACALRHIDGTVHCWGKNDSGQLGDGTTADRAEPVVVKNLRGVIQVAAGASHTCATLADRSAACWGKNDFGQLGDGTRDGRTTPVSVQHIDAVRAMALGDTHSCARLYDGTLRCWGANEAGQLNDGTFETRSLPIMISGLFDVQQIALGDGTICARPADGAVRCWGRNTHGQAGDGTTAPRPVPVHVRW
jgi:alpha-tubulin suppressor-like RCC1 family protein